MAPSCVETRLLRKGASRLDCPAVAARLFRAPPMNDLSSPASAPASVRARLSSLTLLWGFARAYPAQIAAALAALVVAAAATLAIPQGFKLVVDEGFGTQDARGRESLVEAIRLAA